MHTHIFIRHGESDYNNVRPDLTEQGFRQAQQAAQDVAAIVGTKPVRIVSSPLARALDTAEVIAEHLGLTYSDIVRHNAIRCMDFYDLGAMEKLWRAYGSAKAVERAYTSDELFERGTICEKRSGVRARMYQYLAQLFEEADRDAALRTHVHVSHYELLSSLVEDFGFDDTLNNCELIVAKIADPSISGGMISLTFRGVKHVYQLQTPTNADDIHAV